MFWMLKEVSERMRIMGEEDGPLTHLLGKFCDEVTKDKAGNIIGLIRGEEPEKKIMLQARADLPGFLLTNIGRDGKIDFSVIGDISLSGAVYKSVYNIEGLVGTIVPRDENNVGCMDDDASSYVIDIGETSREDAEKYAKCGDTLKILSFVDILGADRRFLGVCGGGRAASSAVAVKCASALAENRPKNDVYFVLSTGGDSLAGCAAANIQPDEALIIGSSSGKLEEGVKVTFRKGSFVPDEALTRRLTDAADRLGIVYKAGESADGGDAGMRIQSEGTGTPSAGLDIPVRYFRTIYETVAASDMEDALRLAEAFVRE